MKIEFSDSEVKAILEQYVRRMLIIGPDKTVAVNGKSYHGIGTVAYHGIGAVADITDNTPAQEDGK